MPCCNTPSCSRAIHQQHPGRHETSAKSHRSDVVSLPSDLRQPCRFQNRGMMTDRHANSALLTYQMPISSTSPDLTSAATGSSHLAQFLLITALSSVCSPVTNCTNAFTWVGAPCHSTQWSLHLSPLALIRSFWLRLDPLCSLHLRPDQNEERDALQGVRPLREPRGTMERTAACCTAEQRAPILNAASS